MTNRLTAVDSDHDHEHVRYETHSRLARRGFGAPWWIALVLIPLLLAALMAALRTGPIEDDLNTRTSSALEGAGLNGVSVDFAGRDASLTVPAGVNGDDALKVVQDVAGVRTASIGDDRASATPTAPGELAAFTIERAGKTLTVTATVPSEADKKALLKAAQASGAKVVDDITVRADTAPLPPAALAALADLKSDAKAEFDGETLTLTGTVPSEEAKAAAADAAEKAVPEAEIDNQLVVATGDGECADLQGKIETALASSIQFAPGSAAIDPQSQATVKAIATAVAACGDAKVEVGGHTDNQGSPATSVPLSQERADAVKALLVQNGVDADRVTAKGYGESEPIASNDSPDGQAQNRRIEIKVQ